MRSLPAGAECSRVVATTADVAPGAAEQQEHGADHQQHDADRPEDREMRTATTAMQIAFLAEVAHLRRHEQSRLTLD